MSTRKKTYTRVQMVDALLDMNRQIVDGSDIFEQAAAMIAEHTPECPVKFSSGKSVIDTRGSGRSA